MCFEPNYRSEHFEKLWKFPYFGQTPQTNQLQNTYIKNKLLDSRFGIQPHRCVFYMFYIKFIICIYILYKYRFLWTFSSILQTNNHFLTISAPNLYLRSKCLTTIKKNLHCNKKPGPKKLKIFTIKHLERFW